jgi:hypothetical protein
MGARAATIAQQESSYQSPDANVNALNKGLRNFIVPYHRNSSNWGDDMNEHFFFDLVRRDP